ncbi:hypothetical protein J3R83DRAFT_7534 [Lanmaoa asiatica]|nr:hypothetical protein J3R83DRAFT_7534 [Lanmaoa asiatica]
MAQLLHPRFGSRINQVVLLLPLASLLALSLPLISALTFNTSTNVLSGHEYTFTWTLDGYEPSVYYIVLSGPGSQVLGNVTLNPEQTSITAIPYVPAGYVLLIF